MDSKEYDVYLAIAQNQLEDAKMVLSKGSSALCVFLSASSAESSTAAMLISMGAKPSKKHRNSLVIHRLTEGAPSEIRPELLEIVQEMKFIEPHVTRSRYPILRGQDLLPPDKFYTNETAQEFLSRSQRILAKAKAVMTSLTER